MTAQYILNDIWNEGFEDGLGGFHMYAPYSGDEYQAYATGWQTGIDRRKREGKLTIVLKEKDARNPEGFYADMAAAEGWA